MPAPLGIITSASLAAGAAAYAYHRRSSATVPPSPSAVLASSADSSSSSPFFSDYVGSLSSSVQSSSPQNSTSSKSAPIAGGFLYHYGKIRRLDEDAGREGAGSEFQKWDAKRSPFDAAAPSSRVPMKLGELPTSTMAVQVPPRRRSASSPNTALSETDAEFWKERFF